LPERKITIENDTIDAIIAAFEQLVIISGKVV
jgi:hypothetical protein